MSDHDKDCHHCELYGMSHREWLEHQSDKDHLEVIKELLKKQWFCKKCNVQCYSKLTFDRHCQTDRHNGLKMTKEQLYCKKCDTQCQNKVKWDEHILTKKHLNTEKEKTEEELYCMKCHTQCHNDYEWDKHILTKKHTTKPFTTKFCNVCKINILNESTWLQHQKTKKHIRNTNTNGTEIPRTIQQGVDQGSQTD